MKKHDQEIQQAFTERFGSAPSALGYTIDSPPFWVTVLLAGGLLAAFVQKPYMVGFYGDEAKFIRTSVWKTTTLQEESMTLRKEQIASAKFKKFGPARYFTVKTKEGATHHLVMNSLYRLLEGQPQGIEAMKNFLGV